MRMPLMALVGSLGLSAVALAQAPPAPSASPAPSTDASPAAEEYRALRVSAGLSPGSHYRGPWLARYGQNQMFMIAP